MSFSRQETSKARLCINWTDSGYVDEQATDIVSIIKSVARESGRPLLILRRSEKQDKKVKRLLDAALKSERFQLASKWFECIEVKGEDVAEKDHDLHLLFAEPRPASILLASPDGKRIVRFLGTSSQKVKWKPIASVLQASYKKDPTKAVKALERLLSKFDALDDRRKELNAQLERAGKKNDRAKMKSIEAKLAKQDVERKKALAEEQRLRDLALRAKQKSDEDEEEDEDSGKTGK